MRHIHEITSLSQLDYLDSFSIQATSEEGSILWKRRFPHLLIQAYYAANDSFILIKNSRTITNSPSSYVEDVQLLTASEEVENHVLLALLHAPQTPNLPLLDHVDLPDHVDHVDHPFPSPIWPVIKPNTTRPFPKPRLPHEPHVPSWSEQFVVFLVISAFILLLYYFYRWCESFFTDPEDYTEQKTPLSDLKYHGDIHSNEPAKVCLPGQDSVESSIALSSTELEPTKQSSSQVLEPTDSVLFNTTTTDLTHFNFVPLKDYSLPLRTGLYRQEFVVCFYLSFYHSIGTDSSWLWCIRCCLPF